MSSPYVRLPLLIAALSLSCFDETNATPDDATTGDTTPTGGTTTSAGSQTSTTAPTGGTTDTTGATGSTTAASEEGSADDTTGVEPGCPNGVTETELDEECDDANDIDGDGCNSDCTLSGRAVWWLDHGQGDADAGRGIAVDAAGDVYACGYVFDVDNNEDFLLWLSKRERDSGEEIWTEDTNPGAQSYFACEAIAISGNTVWLLAEVDDTQSYIQRFLSDDGSPSTFATIHSGNVNTPYSIPYDLAVGAAIYWVAYERASVPSDDQHGFLVRMSGSSVGTSWTNSSSPVGEQSFLRAVAVDYLGNAYVVGSGGDASGNFVQRRLASSGAVDFEVDGFSDLFDIATIPDGDIVIAGRRTSALGDYDVWVARYSADATEQRWQWTYDGDGLADQANAIAIDGDGRVVVGGQVLLDGADGLDRPGLLARLSPTGEELWAREFYYPGDPDDATPSTGVAGVAVDSTGAISIVGSITHSAYDDQIMVMHFTP